MKKSELIELLAKVEGDPDVCFLNGFTGDYHELSSEILNDKLYKIKFENHYSLVEAQRQIMQKNPFLKLTEQEVELLRKRHSEIEYELNSPMIDEFSHFVDEKSVVLIQALPRNKNTFDRLGKVSY